MIVTSSRVAGLRYFESSGKTQGKESDYQALYAFSDFVTR